jgi:glycine/D-amino acid oxidase-like deaminating enzyme
MPEHVFDNGSFWFDSLGDPTPPVADQSLPNAVDVAIVGAGYTGLWTAYYLSLQSPDLNIAVFESNCVGFGASGRNGGWCMGWAMGIDEMLDHPRHREAALAVARAMQNTVDEIGAVCETESIDCHFAKGGTVTVARTPFHAAQWQEEIEDYVTAGFGANDFVWLPPETAKTRLNASGNYGAMYTPHCAAIHPARLVRGLADVLRTKGISIYEACHVTAISPGKLETTIGGATSVIHATTILRATEGYTDSIKGQERQLLPLYSMMVATEPLPDKVFEEIGLGERETFDDGRRVVIYGQRTQDNRIAFGGRAGYYFGSKRKPLIPVDDPHFADVEATLKDLLPILHDFSVTHRWGGLMGVPRHWRPSVLFDPKTRIGSAGGYTGEGVAASNLAGRILAALVLGDNSALTELAWVNDISRRWEPEPLRWLGASVIPVLGNLADSHEHKTGTSSRLWGGLFRQFAG